MNIYTLVNQTAKAARAAQQDAEAAQPLKNGYAVANGAGIEVLADAIEYGIEGDALDARIEQWRADAPATAPSEKEVVAHIEQQVAKLCSKPKARKQTPGNRLNYQQLKAAVGNKGFVHPRSLEVTRYARFGCSWKSPTAHRIKRTAGNQLVSNGEFEGKTEYLSRLSQYEVHPDFGPWIETWLAEHQPINRKGLAPGVSFAKDADLKVGYITQPALPWKIPVAQTVEHWASDARLIEFTSSESKQGFAKHVREFWNKVDTAAAEGQKLLVLLPAAVYRYRFGGKGKRKA